MSEDWRLDTQLSSTWPPESSDQSLSQTEVIETGERVKSQFIALFRAVIPSIASDVASAAQNVPVASGA
jgi:hypothetical protein